jgi:hypothetical protein
MKKQKWVIAFAITVGSLCQLRSQTNSVDVELQKKYWDYRQRFQKHFIAYSPVNNTIHGSGIIINHLNAFNEGGTQNLTNVDIPYYTDNASSRRGIIKEADAPEQLALFFGTLALEYRLLKDEGKDTKSVLNEIYYGIQALNRLDDKAEPFLSQNSQMANRNGFLMRSDADNQLVNHFNSQYAKTEDKKDNIKAISNDYWDPITNAVRSNVHDNTMSKDHVMDILEGFLFLKKFVDNEIIQPTPQEPAITLHNEIIDITNRILSYVTAVRQTTQTELPNIKTKEKGLCTDNEIRYYTNWLIFDEINNKPVHRGNNFNLFAYPIANAAKTITGYPWDNHPVKVKVDGTLCSNWEYTAIDVDLNIGSPNDLIPAVWHGLENQFTDLATAMSNTIHTEVCVDVPPLPQFLGIANNQICIHPQEVEDVINGIVTKTDPVQLLLTLATISNTWSHSNIVAAGDSRFFYHYDLMYSLLNNDTPIHNKQFFENILNSAPCQGPYNFDYPNLYNGQPTWDPIWHHNNKWVHPTDPTNLFQSISTNPEEHGYFHGLDYMFLYNMYRYYYRNQINEDYSNDNSCLCNEKSKIYNNTDNTNHIQLLNNITVKRKFDTYKDINIFTKEYISNNLQILNSKNITNETDLIICNNSLVEVEAGGTLRNQQFLQLSDNVKIVCRPNTVLNIKTNGLLDIKENTKVIIQKDGKLFCGGINSKIIVRSGGKLIIEPGAFLELNNGSKLIVEDGGQVIIQTKIDAGGTTSENGVLTYNQGAIIQLKGNDAVLEINGRLHIGDNAIFGFTYPGSNSGYIKFNRGQGVWWDNWAPNNAHITCGVNSKIQLIGQSKTDKMIDISQINVAIPKNLSLLTLTKCLVDFNVDEARLETDRPTFMSNSTFKGNAFDNYGPTSRGVLMFGQPTFNVNNCDFNSLGSGIFGALFYGGSKLTGVKNCNFNSCGNSIYTIGAGCNILNNNFVNNGTAIASGDIVLNSLYKNNTISTTNPVGPITDYNSPYNSVANIGIFLNGGTSSVNEITSNTINNVDNAIGIVNLEAKIKCNDLQNSMVALWGGTNSKINMSSDLGSGFNNASNSTMFGWFDEANYFEANNGYNAFNISDGSSCTSQITNPGHITTYQCPIITSGSIINFNGPQNPIDNYYQNISENNYWHPANTPVIPAMEDAYNKIYKKDLAANNLLNARMVTGNSLTSDALVVCPNPNTGGCVGAGCRTNNQNHPLDNNNNSSIISTASFYNKRLQNALQFSLNKMDKMQNVAKVNEAADLFTEILKANYVLPVKNSVDKYLLDLSYQKLFTCVSQLTEWHKDTATNSQIPSSLLNRYNDLHSIITLRLNRKDATESDVKEIKDLIYLDDAMIYRLQENRTAAIKVVNDIIASTPKSSHRPLYENLVCVWGIENDAIQNTISVDEALKQIYICNKSYYPKTQVTTSVNSQRMINPKPESNMTYATDYSIAVYPNPTNGNLSIAYSLTEFKRITIEIFNVQGKLMNSYSLNPEDKMINIENLDLENGVYFYNIKGDEKILMSKKLVVVK